MYMNLTVDQSGKSESTGPDLTKVHPYSVNNNDSKAKLVCIPHQHSFKFIFNSPLIS